MQIEENHTQDLLTINGYTNGYIKINYITYTTAIILHSDGISNAPVSSPNELTTNLLLQNIDIHRPPELILIGTGSQQIFLHPKIVANLSAKGIGIESMNTAAACRTYTLLQSEGRKVWAWLWP